MADKVFQELVRPEDADTAQESVEVLRAWVIDKHMQCSLNPSVFADHAQWGVFLADLAHHIATGLSNTHGVDGLETLKGIVGRFEEHLFEQD